MGRAICQAKRTGKVKYIGKPTIEFLEVCKNCAGFVDRAEEDSKGLRQVSMNDI